MARKRKPQLTATPAPWLALFDAVGGRSELATLCRVSESTVFRWSRDNHYPSDATITYVNTLCDSHGVAHVFTTERKASNA